MIFNRSKQYALLAMIELGKAPPDSFVYCRKLAREIGMPAPYLSKLLLQLVNAGLVEAMRGRCGGYRLAQAPASINLRTVMNALDGGREERECLLGLRECGDANACALHCQWRPVKEQLLGLLSHQTLAELSPESIRG